jgi:hypothetical protein
MAGICRGKIFTCKNVPKVRLTLGAIYFRSLSVVIRGSFYGVGEITVKRGPTTAGIKFGFGGKEGRITFAANESSLFVEIIVFATKGGFGALVFNDSFFFGSEEVVGHVKSIQNTGLRI